MPNAEEIKQTVRDYIVNEFLAGEGNELADSTELITGGIIDSIAVLKLVSFLEEHYGMTLEPHEADSENLDTIDQIASLVQGKL